MGSVHADEIDAHAARVIEADIERQAAAYVRQRHLPLLNTRITEAELADQSLDGCEALIERLRRYERAERNRARGGVGTGFCPYSPSRHKAFQAAILAETRALTLRLARAA